MKKATREILQAVAARGAGYPRDRRLIAKGNPRRAAAFVADLHARWQGIGRSPRAAALWPELGPGIRVIVFGRCLLAYHEEDGSVLVDRVIHGARDLTRLFPG